MFRLINIIEGRGERSPNISTYSLKKMDSNSKIGLNNKYKLHILYYILKVNVNKDMADKIFNYLYVEVYSTYRYTD